VCRRAEPPSSGQHEPVDKHFGHSQHKSVPAPSSVETSGVPDEAVAAIAAHSYRPTGGCRISVRWTPDAAFAYMDRQGIVARLMSVPLAFAGSEVDRKFGARLFINEGHAALIAAHPGRFGAFATLPADGPDEALAE
jgi:predicted TIM-barrel fold metal-dependent hydrolase